MSLSLRSIPMDISIRYSGRNIASIVGFFAFGEMRRKLVGCCTRLAGRNTRVGSSTMTAAPSTMNRATDLALILSGKANTFQFATKTTRCTRSASRRSIEPPDYAAYCGMLDRVNDLQSSQKGIQLAALRHDGTHSYDLDCSSTFHRCFSAQRAARVCTSDLDDPIPHWPRGSGPRLCFICNIGRECSYSRPHPVGEAISCACSEETARCGNAAQY